MTRDVQLLGAVLAISGLGSSILLSLRLQESPDRRMPVLAYAAIGMSCVGFGLLIVDLSHTAYGFGTAAGTVLYMVMAVSIVVVYRPRRRESTPPPTPERATGTERADFVCPLPYLANLGDSAAGARPHTGPSMTIESAPSLPGTEPHGSHFIIGEPST